MLTRIIICIIATAATFAFSAAAFEIVGHRGASFDAPENTVTSEKLAFQQGADAGECDIYLTRDGKIMVMHDADTFRTGGVSNKLSRSASTDLRKLEIGQWGQWKGKGFSEKIPFLEEFLDIVPDGKRLFIEIKCGPEILPELERVLGRSGKKPEQIVIIGFSYDVVKKSKERMPQYQSLWLATSDKKTKQYPPVDQLIKQAQAAHLDGLDLHAGFPIDSAFVAKVHQAGLKLYTWTVDDPGVAGQEAAAGVDGITTNRPEWLRGQLKLAIPARP
ncbi:MAG: glycerophosphodiester phosphodiesterase [Verrucomicrobia bacterium]|nr:glycerophosphodiester phosphodiesterase [Verrucomicrobiota bacterium]